MITRKLGRTRLPGWKQAMSWGWLDDRTPTGQARPLTSHTPLKVLTGFSTVVKAFVGYATEMSRGPSLGQNAEHRSRV